MKKSATAEGVVTWPVFKVQLPLDSLVESESSEQTNLDVRGADCTVPPEGGAASTGSDTISAGF